MPKTDKKAKKTKKVSNDKTSLLTQSPLAEANKKHKVDGKSAMVAKKSLDSEDSPSHTSSSESSDNEEEEEDDKTFSLAKTALAEAHKKRKAHSQATMLPKKSSNSYNSSSDSLSSQESSSESDEEEDNKMSSTTQNAPNEAKKQQTDGQATTLPKKPSDSGDSSSDASSHEDSSGESDGEEGDKTSPPAQTALSEANKKRKADNEATAPPKKAKVANGSPSTQTSGEETKSIFVGRLSWNVDNDWLAQEFSECGEVESAYVQMDRNTGRSRGFGYVHFKTADAVEKALALNGKEIDGRAVNIDKSNQADKKTSTEKRAKAFGDTTSPPSAVLFVGNLSFGVDEDALWETFGEHGDVKSVRVPTDRDSGKPKGFAYVEFSEVGSAKNAHGALQGYELDGRSIRLDFSQPRDSAGGRGGGRGARGRGGFGGDRGRGAARGGRGGRGGWGGDRGGRGGWGGDRGGGRGRGRGSRTGGITHFEGEKITF